MNTAVLLSGGVDSAFAGLCVGEGPTVTGVFVDYGQPAMLREHGAASRLASEFGWRLEVVCVAGMPLGQMATGVGPHIVPARNVWLIAIAAAFGSDVWIGCAPQDERDYEDCRLGFLDASDKMLRTIGRRLNWSNTPRSGRIAWLARRGVFDLTWSCYGPGPEPCGECASCHQ